MKIVNLEQFRAMPAGTVFAKYEPCFFGPPEIKDDTLDFDWLYNVGIGSPNFVNGGGDEEFFDCCQRMEDGGSEPLGFDCYGRDGLFEKNQLFAIYEREDVVGLIGAFAEALAKGYSS